MAHVFRRSTAVVSAALLLSASTAMSVPASASAPEMIQAVYVVPSDVAEVAGRPAATSDTVIVVQDWFAGQTGGRYPVFVRDSDAITVPTVVLAESEAQLAALSTSQADSTMKSQINAQVSGSSDSEILAVVEGTVGSACGYTSSKLVVIPIDNCGIAPTHDPTFPYNSTYLVAHELTHLLGAVPSCAPNANGGHVGDDPRDVVYAGPQARDWANITLDPGRDDYYDHGVTGCTDISDSPLLGTWSPGSGGGGSEGCETVPTPFTDVASSSFAHDDIGCLYGLGVTTGTGPTTFGPDEAVTREQMAAFLARLYRVVNGGDAPVVSTPFTDVASSSFAHDDIARLYGLGITNGTSPTTFGPHQVVTREQMAAFLSRLYRVVNGGDAPVVSTPFTDVASSSFAHDDIARLYGLGVTNGTSPTTFGPDQAVTREQMAAFLARLYRITAPEPLA